MRRKGFRVHGTLWRFSLLAALSLLAVLTVSLIVHQSVSGHRVHMARDAEALVVSNGQDRLVQTFRSAVSDLYFLSELSVLVRFVESEDESDATAAAQELLSFLQRRELYEQIQVIDDSGALLLQVTRDTEPPTAATLVASNSGLEEIHLQVLVCPEGLAYMSTTRVSSDQGQETSIHFGVGVRETSSRDASVLLSLRGSELLAALERYRAETSADLILIDDQGYALGGRDENPNHPTGLHYPSRFPEEWQQISTSPRSQLQTANGVFSTATFSPLAEVWDASCSFVGSDRRSDQDDDAPRWVIVSRLPLESVHALVRADLGLISTVGGVSFALLTLGAWLLACRDQRRRHAQAEIAASNKVLSSTLDRYLPDTLRQRLRGDPARYSRLGGEASSVTVVFADLRGFTRFAEVADPQVVMDTLNIVLSRLAGSVLRHGGTLDKYLGDGLMAFFEALPDERTAAKRAVDTALDMQREFTAVRPSMDNDAKDLGLGIGIASGSVVMGNVGSEHAMGFTVIGDPVNVAARLQSAAKSGEILMDGGTASLLDSWVETELLPIQVLKGKRHPVDVYLVRVGITGNRA